MVYIKCWGVWVEGGASANLKNGWIATDPYGPASFRAGVMIDALIHLRKCRECREANGLTAEFVEEKYKEVIRGW